jgi:hypothetical protein
MNFSGPVLNQQLHRRLVVWRNGCPECVEDDHPPVTVVRRPVQDLHHSRRFLVSFDFIAMLCQLRKKRSLRTLA